MSEQENVTDQIEEIPAVTEVAATSTLVIDDSENEHIGQAAEEIKNNKSVEELSDTKTSRQKQGVYQEFSINASEKLTSGVEITLPANFDKETKEALEHIPNVNLLDDPGSREWANTVAEGLEHTTFNECFVNTLEDPDAEFKHKNEHSGISLMAQAPKFKAAENENLKGERAVLRLITHLGLGTLYQTPLFHSGMWVTFKPPTESEIIELNRAMINDKIKFGRYTYGLAFSNITSYTIDKLVDFVLSHVYDINIKAEDVNLNNLKSHISCQDIPSLLWGFICTMYPRGFKYKTACISNPEKCNYVVEETINVTKLQWTNTRALTDWQKTHMTGRQPKCKDLASIKRYKEELAKIQKKRITINEGTDKEISITIKTPSIEEYIDAGHRWIGDITETVDKALGSDNTENERNNTIIRYGQASAMRQYNHWIDSIEYQTNIIDDKETIEQLLDTLSADDEIRNAFIQAVVDYINNSTISVIGIPVFDCPKCGITNESQYSLPTHKNIIPLDMVQLFFALHTQRLNKLTER